MTARRPPRVRELRAIYGTPSRLAPTVGPLRTPDAVARYLAPYFANLAHEHIGALYVDTQMRPIVWRLIGRGTLDAAICTPRDVLQAALIINAAGFHLAHNHPSGDPTPSRQDRALDKQMRAAAEILGIEMHSCLILGATHAYDLREPAGLYQIAIDDSPPR